jgi:NADPH-dependent curcumin reductase CurA
MAELEEGSHAAIAEGDSMGRITRLTAKHVTAATSTGVVHFVARQQAGDVNYENDRAQRVLVKYFASTMAAYFQWIGLNAHQRCPPALRTRRMGL